MKSKFGLFLHNINYSRYSKYANPAFLQVVLEPLKGAKRTCVCGANCSRFCAGQRQVSTNHMSESYSAAAGTTGGKKQKLGESEGKSHPFTTRPSVATLCGRLSGRCVSQREELVAEHSAVKQPREEKCKLSPYGSCGAVLKCPPCLWPRYPLQPPSRSCVHRHFGQRVHSGKSHMTAAPCPGGYSPYFG